MIDFAKTLVLLGVIVISGGIGHTAPPPNQPNVLFIAIDDLNSCLGGMKGEISVPTPNMDRLAARGVLFANAHCAAPACNPSRVAMMTGMAPTSSGIYTNKQDWRESKTLRSIQTLPHHFRQHGYSTRGGGKLYHAASLSEKGYQGYLDPRPWDEFFPSKLRQMPAEALPPQVPTNGDKQFYGGRFDWAELDIETDEMADAKVVSWAEDHLSSQHAQPQFLAVGIYRPHIPWYTPKQFFDKHPLESITLPEVVANDLDDVPIAGQNMARRHWHKWLVEHNQWESYVRAYKASVSFADEMVGRLIGALDDGPMAENTIVVLWSDHGYHLGQKEHWEKFALWEQTTRVPLIIVAPGVASDVVTVKTACLQPVSLLDVYPTLNEMCGLKSPAHELDGQSLVPLLKNPATVTGRAVVCTQGEGNHAIRTERWRYIRYRDGSAELYDQIDDPKNFRNLSELPQHKSTRHALTQHLPTNAHPAEPAPERRANTERPANEKPVPAN